jgi:hypothetical protein
MGEEQSTGKRNMLMTSSIASILMPGLDKKIRVAFDWTLDLLFPKDACAVYDPGCRRNFDGQEHVTNASLRSSTRNSLKRSDLVGAK